MRKVFTIVMAGGLAVTAGAGLAACDGDDAAENLAEEVSGGDVDIDSDDGSVSVETDDGSFAAGSCEELPEDFPSDVPTPDADPTFCTRVASDGVTNWSLGYSTDDADKVGDYKSTLEDDGFEITGEASYEVEGTSYESFSANKGTYLVNVGGGGAGVGVGGDADAGIFVTITDDPDAQ